MASHIRPEPGNTRKHEFVAQLNGRFAMKPQGAGRVITGEERTPIQVDGLRDLQLHVRRQNALNEGHQTNPKVVHQMLDNVGSAEVAIGSFTRSDNIEALVIRLFCQIWLAPDLRGVSRDQQGDGEAQHVETFPVEGYQLHNIGRQHLALAIHNILFDVMDARRPTGSVRTVFAHERWESWFGSSGTGARIRLAFRRRPWRGRPGNLILLLWRNPHSLMHSCKIEARDGPRGRRTSYGALSFSQPLLDLRYARLRSGRRLLKALLTQERIIAITVGRCRT